MMSKWMTFALLVIGVLFLNGCGQQASGQPQPEPIEEGVDKCEICHMNVADGPHATQILTAEGEHLKFDDIGCMVRDWMPEHEENEQKAVWVRDYETNEWIAFQNAYFVYDETIRTPMAYGVLSFDTEEKAQAYIDENQKGTIMTSEDLLETHSWERNMDMMKEPMKQNHDH